MDGPSSSGNAEVTPQESTDNGPIADTISLLLKKHHELSHPADSSNQSDWDHTKESDRPTESGQSGEATPTPKKESNSDKPNDLKGLNHPSDTDTPDTTSEAPDTSDQMLQQILELLDEADEECLASIVARPNVCFCFVRYRGSSILPDVLTCCFVLYSLRII